MTVTPAGIESLPLSNLAAALAALTTFQTWVGADDATEAAAFIHTVHPSSTYVLPCVVIDISAPMRREPIAVGIAMQHSTLDVCFLATVTSGHTAAEAAYTILNSVGAILAELLSSSTLNIEFIERAEKPMRTAKEEIPTLGDSYRVDYTIGIWGP